MIWAPIALLVVLIGVGAWYALSKNAPTSNSSNVNGMTNATNQPALNANAGANTNTAPGNTNVASNTNSVAFPMPGWSLFHDTEFGLTFQYPSDWSVTRLSPGSNLPAHPEQVWPGAISIRYPDAQEESPSFKAVSGGFDEALAWINAHVEQVASTSETTELGVLNATVVRPRQGSGNVFAIAVSSRYALIALLDPVHRPTVGPLYQQILDTLRYSAN
jgi:hypothetical protein